MSDKNKKELEQQLILDNIRAVVAQALNFKPNAVVDIDDYKQEGLIALLKAIRKHNPNRGKLVTYAWKAIYRAIARTQKRFSDKNKKDIDISLLTSKNIDDYCDFLPELTEEEFTIVMMRAYGYTLLEIGESLKKTKQSVHIILKKIRDKIQNSNENNTLG